MTSVTTSQGFSQSTKDRFEVVSKSVAIVGGILSAVMLIVTLHLNTVQKSRELRWNQARLATQLVDEMLADPRAFDALRMIDWDRRKYKIDGGQEVEIGSVVVKSALNVENNDKLTLRNVYIRECFDRLFHHMGKLGRAVKSELVLFEDIRSPLGYYVDMLRSRYGDTLTPYMKQLGQEDALILSNLFPPK